MADTKDVQLQNGSAQTPEQFKMKVEETCKGLDQSSNGHYDFFGPGPVRVGEFKSVGKQKYKLFKLDQGKKGEAQTNDQIHVKEVRESAPGCCDMSGNVNFEFNAKTMPSNHPKADQSDYKPYILQKPQAPFCGKQRGYILFDNRDPADKVNGKEQLVEYTVTKPKCCADNGFSIDVREVSGKNAKSLKTGELMFQIKEQKQKNCIEAGCKPGGFMNPISLMGAYGDAIQFFCIKTQPPPLLFEGKQENMPQGGKLHMLPHQNMREACLGAHSFQIDFPTTANSEQFVNGNQKQQMIQSQLFVNQALYENK